MIVKNIILDIKNPFLLEIRLFLYKKTIFWNQKVDILSKKKKIKNEVHVHALMNHINSIELRNNLLSKEERHYVY